MITQRLWGNLCLDAVVYEGSTSSSSSGLIRPAWILCFGKDAPPIVMHRVFLSLSPLENTNIKCAPKNSSSHMTLTRETRVQCPAGEPTEKTWQSPSAVNVVCMHLFDHPRTRVVGACLAQSRRQKSRNPESHRAGKGIIDNLYARRRVAHGEIALGTRRETIRRRRR